LRVVDISSKNRRCPNTVDLEDLKGLKLFYSSLEQENLSLACLVIQYLQFPSWHVVLMNGSNYNLLNKYAIGR